MKWLRCLVLVLCAFSLSCTSDGGPAGTGISSTAAISGNIVDVQTTTATASSVIPMLPPIQVSIDGLPHVTTMVDSSGSFALSGAFAGSVTLRFAVPQFQVTQQLDVPAGSAVVLQDIELHPDGVVTQAARQLNFFGTVDMVDCADGTLLVHDRRSDGMQYLVHLSNQTMFLDGAGQAQTCGAIVVGRPIAIEGSIAYSTDRTITALVVTIAPPPPPPPPQEEVQAHFSGVIALLDCTAGFIVVDDSVERTTVQLTAETEIQGASGGLTCQDLHLNDPVRGEGQINLNMPGTIVASQLTVTGSPNSGQTVRLMGFVTAIDCAGGVLELGDDEASIEVRIVPATMISGRGGQSLLCADIQLGDRVQGVGKAVAGTSGTVNAVQLMVTARQSINDMRAR